MSNCIYIKNRLKKNKLYIFCKKRNDIITFDDCKNCIYKEYPRRAVENKIKKRTYKQAKAEKNRFSLFTDDLEHCIICGKSPVNKHEIFYGRNRQNSIKYGLVIPLCQRHHTGIDGIHFNTELCDFWHKKGQTRFNEVYPDLNFEDVFKRNYL